MTEHRWIGYIGMTDRADVHDRVLTLDAHDDLDRYLKWDIPRFPYDDTPAALRCDLLPLPLLSPRGDRIGGIDTLAVTRLSRIAAAGTITPDPDTHWGATLLLGGGQPAVLTHDQGKVTELHVRRRPLANLWRPVTRTFRVLTDWRVTGAVIDDSGECPWRPNTYIRLSARNQIPADA